MGHSVADGPKRSIYQSSESMDPHSQGGVTVLSHCSSAMLHRGSVGYMQAVSALRSLCATHN